jgi:carbon storage regulator
MLKLTLKPGDYIDIGENVRVVFSGGSANNIHLLVDAPREINIARSSAGGRKANSPYYAEQKISEEAQKEIVNIIRREKSNSKKVSKRI